MLMMIVGGVGLACVKEGKGIEINMAAFGWASFANLAGVRACVRALAFVCQPRTCLSPARVCTCCVAQTWWIDAGPALLLAGAGGVGCRGLRWHAGRQEEDVYY
jgi:hypothetical protein